MEREHFERPDRETSVDREFDRPDREAPDRKTSDREGRSEQAERGLGAERHVRELQQMQDSFREWVRENDFETGTGSRSLDRTTNTSTDRDSPWSLMDDATGRGDPAREFHLIDAEALSRGREWVDLTLFAMERGFVVTGMNEQTGHNPGSAHYQGRAIDVRTRGMTNEQVEALIRDARQAGYRVRDERTRPAGQRVWGGPHVHMEAPRPRNLERSGARNRGSELA